VAAAAARAHQATNAAAAAAAPASDIGHQSKLAAKEHKRRKMFPSKICFWRFFVPFNRQSSIVNHK
jgi:hypothetical protein